MQIHLVQCDSAWMDKTETFARVDAMMARHAILAGGLIVLPEMFDTGFSFELERTADGDERTLEYLIAMAKRTGCTVHGARTVLGSDARGLNRTTVIGPEGAVLCEYDKVHPFSFGKESEFFTGGTEVKQYRWSGGGENDKESVGASWAVCPAICYDLRFPELFRAGAAMGAELFVVPANWPAARQMHRVTLARARAIENQAVVVCLNRAGRDPHLVYDGGSVVFDAKGEVLGEMGSAAGVMTVEVDVDAVRQWRSAFPALRDRRDEIYGRWRTGG